LKDQQISALNKTIKLDDTLNSYRPVNTLRLGYTNQSVNVV